MTSRLEYRKVLLAMAIFLSPFSSHADSDTAIGFELYSWQANGVWRYAVEEGTSVVHNAVRLRSPRTRLKNVTALKGRFATMTPGEKIYWRVDPARGFALPDQETVQDLRRFAEGLQVRVLLPDEEKPVDKKN